VLTAE